MINETVQKLQDKDKKRLIENFTSLSVLQGVNYVLPLITIPYLIRVLGAEKFGLVMFAQAFIMYFNILTDYGFNFSATREISVCREDKEKVSEIFSSVTAAKFILLAGSFILLCAVILIFEKFRQNLPLYYLSFGAVIGQTVFPVWFFQGIEKMKYIAFFNILGRLIFTVSVFVFVHKAGDYLYVPLINSAGYIIAGILAFGFAARNFKTGFFIPKISGVKYRLKEGAYLFISTSSINVYKTNSVFILGLFSSSEIVGYFYIAKKSIDVLNHIAGTISTTIYPYVNKKISGSLPSVKRFLKNIGLVIAVYTLLIGIVLTVFSKDLTVIIAGKGFKETILSIDMLAFVPFITGINVPAVQILLGRKRDKEFFAVLTSAACIDIALNFVLVPPFSYIGSCFSVIITEILVTAGLYAATSARIKPPLPAGTGDV